MSRLSLHPTRSELVDKSLRVLSHETASTSAGTALSWARGFARKVGDANKGNRGKPLPPDQQLKLSEKTMQNFQKLLDPTFKPAVLEQSKEDEERWRQMQRMYSRRRMADLRERQRHLQTLIRLKQEALQALPPVLRAHAEVPDDSPFPLLRGLPTHTPPLEGYEERVMGLQDQANETELGQFFGGSKRR